MAAKTKGPLHVEVMRSQLGRVRGLGAARSGVAVWWAERVTSIALIPLTLWFVVSILRLVGAPQAAVRLWAGNPINAGLLLALVVTTFHHTQLGLQVIIEDYVHHESTRMVSQLAMKGVVAFLGLVSVVATLKLAF
jgi:succinate dehydrogenase / fumarate reductase, membrane anchor subunit